MKRPAPPPSPPPTRPIVFRWDLDKTYLQTELGKLRDLVRIPFERAEDKVNVPGVVPLIRALKQGGGDRTRQVLIHFISASPPQIGAAIREKLRLDGVEYDDIVFKNQLQNIVRGKFRNLREQIGYKLSELLANRATMPPDAQEVLFGDDWESDPIIYSIYADVLAGRLPADELRQILESIHVDPALVRRSLALCPAQPAEVVLRIYINLERRIPLANFHVFGPRLVPAFNYLQTAACLYEDGHLSIDAVAAVARSLAEASGFSPERIANSINDIERRGHLSSRTAAEIRSSLTAVGVLPGVVAVASVKQPWWRRLASAWRRRLDKLRRFLRPAVVPDSQPAAAHPSIDYRTLVSEWRALREGARA